MIDELVAVVPGLDWLITPNGARGARVRPDGYIYVDVTWTDGTARVWVEAKHFGWRRYKCHFSAFQQETSTGVARQVRGTVSVVLDMITPRRLARVGA